jgi:formylglycine-generating enzyme required for sulfatase activity
MSYISDISDLPSRSGPLAALVCILLAGPSAHAAVDFETEIKPIIESACLHCHFEANAEGGLRLDSLQAAMSEEVHTAAIVPGDAESSPFYALATLPHDDPQVMPPEGPPLHESQLDRIRQWIDEGARWPKDAKLTVQPRIDFAEHVQPILEMNCLSCHSGEEPEGAYDMTTHESVLESGSTPPSLEPFKPLESTLYTSTVLPKDDPAVMPPVKQGGPLAKDATEILRLWISQGAIWPKGVTLKKRFKPPTAMPSPDNMQLVQQIHSRIVERSKGVDESSMKDYSSQVPQTSAPYHMVALEGGAFSMGSTPDEPGRQENEGPQQTIDVSPFWIGKYEVTWDEYEPFMITAIDRYKNGARKDYDPEKHTIVDAVTAPTAPYTEMSFGMGQYGFPAISMTQHAANKYCQWLSAQTGHFYRLPTEAEWEYACRAGTQTAYSFGNDPAELDKYAWYVANSGNKYQKIGTKLANPWGLHDMHGNVAEWTADQFVPDYFQRVAESPSNPFIRPKTLYPRTVRGGGWSDSPEQLRSAFRKGSEPMWQQQDPQLPKSIWYLTDAQWLGFRIVRPLKVPSVEEMYFYWNSSSYR